MKKSIKTKLFLILMGISAIPLCIILILISGTMISNSIQDARQSEQLRNETIQEHMNELFGRNLSVLRSIAINPMIRHYLNASPDNRDPQTEQFLHDTNLIFDDPNNLILTDTNADQLIRSDGYPPVNIRQRVYFYEAMKGKESISDVVTSLATGRFISVIEVPVLDTDGSVIGLVQRDYDLAALQAFVRRQANEKSSVLVIDRQGKLLADSRKEVENEEDRIDETNYPFVKSARDGASGVVEINFEGERSLVSYSKNTDSGWIIVTVCPFRYIRSQVIRQMARTAAVGLVFLLLISFFAYYMADKITLPIREISAAADEIAENNSSAAMLAISARDELGKMAAAFNKISSSRNDYKLNAEMDGLTQLYNKVSTERICAEALEEATDGKLTAFYIIDLDHFKEINDTLGHQCGDEVLQDFARRLKKVFRPTDCVGRFGGDEFVAMITGLPDEEIIYTKARQILQAAAHTTIRNKNAGISASIGIAVAPLHGTDYSTLFHAADRSVYFVKESGRNGYCYGTRLFRNQSS